MKFIYSFLIFGIFLFNDILFAQIENVPLNNLVYSYLKEMEVKKVISGLNDDNINLSRFEVKEFLNRIEQNKNVLTEVEKEFLNKYQIEFNEGKINNKNTTFLFGNKKSFGKNLKDIFSNKEKYLFGIKKEKFNFCAEGLINSVYGNELKPNSKNNTYLVDFGLRLRGSVADFAGYFLEMKRGSYWGSRELAGLVEPSLNSNFKFIENKDEFKSYDFTSGYVKFFYEPVQDLKLFFQFGREKIKYGYGYGDKLVLSGNNPDMDFIKLNASYGIVNFSYIHASTVGEYNADRSLNYTKYFVAHRLKFSFDNLFDIGVGESVVYSRALDFGYLNPLLFYKSVEHSLQDRDNSAIHFDIETHFIKNVQLQATLFMDELNFGKLTSASDYENKFAYQIGIFWYEAFWMKNLSFVLEYTKIRPYVYTHLNYKNTYTSYGINLGHPSGPNSDELFTKLTYNLNSKVKLSIEYRKNRFGKNIYDDEGNLVKNVGGDIFQPKRDVDSEEVIFLDGIRINSDNVITSLRIEPIEDYIFELAYNYRIENNITSNTKTDYGFGLLKFILEY